MLDVAVIGGGVSGLATAHALMRRGHRAAVLERQVRAGGTAISERIDGFLMEHGPSTINAAVPEAARLSSALGLDAVRCELGPGVRHRYLVGDGRLHGIATHPFGFLTSDYLSLRGRLRAAGEWLVPARRDEGDETVEEFWTRRFGREFTDRVVDPLVAGLYSGVAGNLSMSAVFPVLQDMERRHGSISRGMLRHRLADRRMPARRLFSWRDGIGSLPGALAAGLGPALRNGVTVRRIRRTAQGFRIDAGRDGAIEARAVVLATQPHVAAALLEPLDDGASAAAASIDAPPIAVVFLGYRRAQIAHPLDGLGYLVPRSERMALAGVLFCSTMFEGRAPEGHVALSAYIGGARAPDLAGLAPGDLVALARDELGNLLGARGDPVVTRVRQWPRGLPQYAPGHAGRIAALRAAEEALPGLFLTGNYFSGPSVGVCLDQAATTARSVDGYLARSAESPAGHARMTGCRT